MLCCVGLQPKIGVAQMKTDVKFRHTKSKMSYYWLELTIRADGITTVMTFWHARYLQLSNIYTPNIISYISFDIRCDTMILYTLKCMVSTFLALTILSQPFPSRSLPFVLSLKTIRFQWTDLFILNQNPFFFCSLLKRWQRSVNINRKIPWWFCFCHILNESLMSISECNAFVCLLLFDNK